MTDKTGVRSLSPLEVKYILSRRDSKALTAAKLGVSKQTVARVRRGQIYADLYQEYTGVTPPTYSYARTKGHYAQRLDDYNNNPYCQMNSVPQSQRKP